MDEQIKEFIEKFKLRYPRSDFFNEARLSLTGETLDTMRVLSDRAILETPGGESGLVRVVPCVCIASKQRIRKGEMKSCYHYFDMNTLEWVMTKR